MRISTQSFFYSAVIKGDLNYSWNLSSNYWDQRIKPSRNKAEQSGSFENSLECVRVVRLAHGTWKSMDDHDGKGGAYPKNMKMWKIYASPGKPTLFCKYFMILVKCFAIISNQKDTFCYKYHFSLYIFSCPKGRVFLRVFILLAALVITSS